MTYFEAGGSGTPASQLYADKAPGLVASPDFIAWNAPAYTIGTNIVVSGADGYTLQPGFTYELFASIVGNGADDVINNFTWVSTTLTPVGELQIVGAIPSTAVNQKTIALAVFTPLIATDVHLEYVSSSPGNEITLTTETFIKITQLGV